MKPSKIALVAACIVGSAGIAASYAGTAQRAAPGAHHDRMHVHKHERHGPPLARLVQRLDLTDAQRQSVRSILESSAEQRRALRKEQRATMKATLSTMPDDPSYPALIDKRKQLASAAIQHRSDLNVQIYSLLTEEQKARLPMLIEEMQARMKKKHERRRDKTRNETNL